MILALTVATVLGVTDLEGRQVDPFDAGARAVVFVFVRSDCPVSNRYVPELNRLYARYRDRGVRLWLVYSGDDATAPIVRSHRTTYELRAPALLDPRFTLADKTGVTMTPEVAVYDARRLVYRGRIDDRAQGVGLWRAAPTSRDLAEVLRRLDQGDELTYRTTQAVGCYLKPLS